MKLHIKEAHQLAFPEDTISSLPPKKVVTKGANKRMRSTKKESLMGRIPSMCERVDSNFSMVNHHKLSHHSKMKSA